MFSPCLFFVCHSFHSFIHSLFIYLFITPDDRASIMYLGQFNKIKKIQRLHLSADLDAVCSVCSMTKCTFRICDRPRFENRCQVAPRLSHECMKKMKTFVSLCSPLRPFRSEQKEKFYHITSYIADTPVEKYFQTHYMLSR